MPNEELNLVPKEQPQVETQPADVDVEQPVEEQESQKEKIEQKEQQQEESRQDVQEARAPVVAPPEEPSPVVKKDPVLVDLEDILADDLTDIFLSLPDDQKQAFKEKGEEVAVKIKDMVDRGKVKVRKVLDLIREWLRMVPGVNKFFLQQEAKIKADKVIAYAREQKAKSQNNV